MDKIDYIFLTVGAIVGLSEIDSYLGIILLCIQIVWLFVKIGIKIYNYVKHKQPVSNEYIERTTSELIDLLNKVQEEIEKRKEQSDEHKTE